MIAVNVSPGDAAAGFGGFVERQNLKLSLFEIARQRFSRFLYKVGNLGAPGILGDGDHLGFVIAIQIVRPIRADGRKGEVNFGAKLAACVLKTEAEWIGAVPIDEQQIVPAITINVEKLSGFDRPRVRNLNG